MLFENQKILVLGLGLSGRAAARFLIKRGAAVWGVDQNQTMLEENLEIAALKAQGVHILPESRFGLFNSYRFDKVIVSPGIPQTHPIYRSASDSKVEIIGEVELACRSMSNRCVAITGSNGKTTTTLLAEHALNYSGIKAKAVGNVGIPLTDAIEGVDQNCVIVLELSSWQLETMHSQVIDAGVVLNITPNHLDRHLTMEAYARAKLNLLHCLKPGKTLYMGVSCYKDFAHLIQGYPVKTFGYDLACELQCDKKAVLLHGNVEFALPAAYIDKGSHDGENMLAAYALCREMGLSGCQFAAAQASFKKPPHRIEFVRKFKGVAYYDDSKGTNIEAVTKAIETMDGPTILIAGGVHKGAAYTPWLKFFVDKVRCICAIGQAASAIEADLGGRIPVQKFMTFEEAIRHASVVAKEGENVLLSPGCSSYDMFKNYEQRGEEFKRIVHALATEG